MFNGDVSAIMCIRTYAGELVLEFLLVVAVGDAEVEVGEVALHHHVAGVRRADGQDGRRARRPPRRRLPVAAGALVVGKAPHVYIPSTLEYAPNKNLALYVLFFPLLCVGRIQRAEIDASASPGACLFIS
ncbi:hypothetical protein ABZP36_011963 [Zizania latifolia]